MISNSFENKVKNKLNNFYANYAGNEKRPTYFNIAKTYPSLTQITENFSLIKSEFNNVLEHIEDLPRYHDLDPNQKDISGANEKKWNVFMLSSFGHKIAAAQQLCPQTCSLLKKIPNLMQAFFSILEPGKDIPIHSGPYMGYIRYHLGIQVPENKPPKIIINKKPYTWKDGEAVLFDDSWPHEVINKSQDFRAVLIIDVLRPMPFIPHMVNKFIINCIARYSYGLKLKKLAKGFNPDVKPLFQ